MIKKYHVSKNLFDVSDYTNIQTNTNGSASNVSKTSSTISFKSNGDYDFSGIYINSTYYISHITDYNASTRYTLSADVYTDVPCTVIFGGSATIVNIPSGTSRLSFRFSGGVTLAVYVRNTTANITLSKIMFAINETTYEPYSSEVWRTIPYRKYGTEIDTITTLPKQIIGDGQPITNYTIKGNMQQSGTPTPSNPIYPSECGERTENLFDFDSWADSIAFVYGDGTWSINDKTITITSVNQADAYTAPYDNTTIYGTSYKIFVKPNTQYTAKAYIYTSGCRIVFFENGNVDTSDIHTLSSDGSISFTTKSTTTYLTFRCGISSNNPLGTTLTMGNIMLNEGSTALPYEPYGYKFPIVSGGVTTNVYLREPLRKIDDTVDSLVSTGTVIYHIKKLVLTGQESNWAKSDETGDYTFFQMQIIDQDPIETNNVLCTHYAWANVYTTNTTVGYCLFSSGLLRFRPPNVATDFTTKQDWLDWLATQYSAGTPVTIWYVLATAQTESLTVPTLSTTGTAEQFDVDTTLKPSEVSLTYHGWHEHSDAKFTE